MKNKIDWDSRIKRLQLMALEQERQKKEEKNKDSNIRRDFIQDEEKRVQELNRKAPLEKTHLQGPSDFLRRIIGKKLSGYNIDDDPEISKVLKKGTADPKLRGITDNKLLYAYNEEEVQKNPEEDRMKICQKYAKPLPKILNEDDLRIYECPDLLYI
ncbi:hypothetical protein TUBRATIS_27300 [Tubulinosema ratisbonensis]|uniref:Uncharacterized protein n=1 Tax=Tubulinosema ratisbonensis TaxID=291195 RepID=A0A437AID0_9MICR|nr:hypothetical protein TUBRATIS_27300 [Tubulinosema ratisbonensis]